MDIVIAPSAAALKANQELLARMEVAPPFTGSRVLTSARKPEPSVHCDPRMHLTLDDMPKAPPVDLAGTRTVAKREHKTQVETEREQSSKRLSGYE